MAFLILTRQGFEDLQASPRCLDSPLWLNKDLLSEEEIALLRDAGAQVSILPERVDPDSAEEVGKAAASIQESGGGLVWVERPPVAPEANRAEPIPLEQPKEQAAGRSTAAMRQSFEAAGKAAAAAAGRALSRIRKMTTPQGPVLIMPYMGYGTRERFLILGRVLKDEGFTPPDAATSKWDNLVDLYKRLESDEVPGARIRAFFKGEVHESVSDQDGYFRFDIRPGQPLTESGWHTVELKLDNPRKPRPSSEEAAVAVAPVLVPSENARFGIISDIDDTVLWTNVANKMNMLLMLARSNAHTRKPFKGVSAFYRALRDGAGGNEGNPVFYVSNSPWNLYTPLVDFLKVQDIPLGPLLLRDLGMKSLLAPGERHSHKLEKIEHILQAFPDLPFILIGDSGEQDPEIYARVVKHHPGQIRAIYIRSVNPDPSRIEAIDRLIEEVRNTGAQLVLAPDSEFAAVHAASQGLISAASVEEVRKDKKGDERWTGSAS